MEIVKTNNSKEEISSKINDIRKDLINKNIISPKINKLIDQIEGNAEMEFIDLDILHRSLINHLLQLGEKKKNVESFLTEVYQSLEDRKLSREIEDNTNNDVKYLDFDDYEDGFVLDKSLIRKKKFTKEKNLLQIELLKLQEWVKTNKTVCIIFEGRDSAGKGSAIKRFVEYLDPKHYNIIALGVPTEKERKNWFQRYEKQIQPNKINFFDRSWYNRAVVEPVMGYSSMDEYNEFMENVNKFEKKLIENKNIILFKLWFSITKETQAQRFKARQDNPLKYWKFSPNDAKILTKWDEITKFKEIMLSKTSDVVSWCVVDSNDKRVAILNSMRYVLNHVNYDNPNQKAIKIKYPEVLTIINQK